MVVSLFQVPAVGTRASCAGARCCNAAARLRNHLQSMASRTSSIYVRPDPSNSGAKHLVFCFRALHTTSHLVSRAFSTSL